MKGYQKNTTLYIFPQEAAEIPYVASDVTKIAIQPELLEEFKVENPDYASLMVAYNYNIMTVLQKEWAGHTNDDISSPKVDPELEWSASTATAQIGETNTYPTLTNPNSVTVTYSSSDTTAATINETTGVVTLVAAGTTTISAIFAGDDTYNAQTVTYTLTVVAAKVSPNLSWSAESATAQIGETNTYPTLSNPNSVTVAYSSSDTTKATIDASTGAITLAAAGTTTISAIFDGDSTYNAQTVTYTLTVVTAKVSPNLSWSVATKTVTYGYEGNTYPTLTNPNSVTVTYSSSDTTKATIDSSTGVITLIAGGETTISAIFTGDATYNPQTVTYALTIQKGVPDVVWSSNAATVQIGETNTYPTLSNPHSVPITEYTSTNTAVATIDASTGAITLLSAGTTIISAHFASTPQYLNGIAPYTLTVVAAKIDPALNYTTQSGVTVVQIGETNTFPTLVNTYSVSPITYTSSNTSVATVASDGTVTLLSAGDTTITASFAGDSTYTSSSTFYDMMVLAAKPSPNLSWSAESATAQIGETNTYPTLSNPNSVTVTYSSSDTTKATIDTSTGAITLAAAGTTTISAVFAGDSTYAAQTVTYTLTVLAAKVSPNLSWSANSATAQIGGTNTYPTLTNPNSVTVTYTSSDTSAATINQSTGVVTLVAAGSTNISAVFAGNQTYTAQTVTYALTVQAAQPQGSTYDITYDRNLSEDEVQPATYYLQFVPQNTRSLSVNYQPITRTVQDDDWAEFAQMVEYIAMAQPSEDPGYVRRMYVNSFYAVTTYSNDNGDDTLSFTYNGYSYQLSCSFEYDGQTGDKILATITLYGGPSNGSTISIYLEYPHYYLTWDNSVKTYYGNTSLPEYAQSGEQVTTDYVQDDLSGYAFTLNNGVQQRLYDTVDSQTGNTIYAIDFDMPEADTTVRLVTLGETDAYWAQGPDTPPDDCSSVTYNLYTQEWGTTDGSEPYVYDPDNLTWTYSSDDENVATVNSSTGAISIVDEGSCTIYAYFAGSSSFVECDFAMSLTVINENPEPEPEPEEPEEEPEGE